MNFANPILICDQNEAFRSLLREMLIKNGFFHIVETASTSEAQKFLQDKSDYFILIHPSLVDAELTSFMTKHKKFLVLANSNDESTVRLAALLGVEHVMNFPVHSKNLVEKISKLLQ